jgi:glycosyltransferase involved in cell wall biosynthesis
MQDNTVRICIIYNWFYPAYKAGGPIQSLVNLAAELNNELNVNIICSNREYDGVLLDVPFDKWVKIKNAHVYYNSRSITGVTKALKGADILFINGIYSFVYNLYPALFLSGRKIISVRGMLHPEGLAEKAVKKQFYLFVWKMLRLHRRCEFHATSEREKEFIQKVFGNETKVWVAQNFPNILEYDCCSEKQKGKLRMTTVALISPMKNHLSVLRALKQCTAEIKYWIYGPIKDQSYWRTCQEIIKELPVNISVVYQGALPPDKIDEVLSRTQVYIQPSKSENFGHSLFEALSKGRPVITSKGTPWNDLQNNKAGLNIAPEKIDALADGISFFADMEEENFAEWSKGAKAFSEKVIDIKVIKREYIAMFTNDNQNRLS